MDNANIDDLILKLHDVNAVKFGEYKMKSGIMTPIYIDLRVLVSHPALMNQVNTVFHSSLTKLRASRLILDYLSFCCVVRSRTTTYRLAAHPNYTSHPTHVSQRPSLVNSTVSQVIVKR